MIELITSGIHSSLQDLGRTGYRQYGVPVGGAMDHISAINANRLVDNPDEAQVLEIMHSGPKLLFQQASVCAVQGGFGCKVDGQLVNHTRSFAVATGSSISFVPLSHGVFGYLSVKGGFKLQQSSVDGKSISRLIPAKKLIKADKLTIGNPDQPNSQYLKLLASTPFISSVLEAYPGPEYDDYKTVLSGLESKIWTLSSKSNRMSYQLDQNLDVGQTDILSSPVQPGTVQLTPSGKLHILMRDCQTTGGYARVLQLTEQSVNLLAQKRPGTELQIKLISSINE